MPTPSVRRYKDFKLVYDLDFQNRSRVIRQRVYTNEDGSIQTPITSLAAAKEYTGIGKVPIAIEFTPRNILTCFVNLSTESQTTELTVVVTYHPSDRNFKSHVREILDYEGVASGFYTGEKHSVSTKLYL